MEQFKLRFIVATFVCLIFAAHIAFGQTNNSLTDNVWALQFQVSNNFTLTSFQGTVLSLKRQLSPNHAIRLGVGGSMSTSDNTTLNSAIQNDTLTSAGSNSGNGTASNIQLNLQYLWYPDPDANVNLFFGAGPLVSYSNSSNDGDNINSSNVGPSNGSVRTSSGNSTSLGISGLFGAEWFAFKSFSLHAEYGAAVRYSWSDVREDQVSRTFRSSSETKSKGWSSVANSVRLGVSVYL